MNSKLNGQKIIDCDIHNVVPSIETLLPYLSAHWCEYIAQSGFKGPIDDAYPPGAPTSARPDTRPHSGGPPASDLDLVREQVLNAWNLEYGILNCTYAVESLHNPDAATALANAVNEWQIAEWLDPESRLRASLIVPSHYPELAAQEINRLGDHPGFVQVFLPIRSAVPYGNRRYHPIYEAAVRHNLVIGFHFGGSPGNPPTPTGWPSYYIEDYAGMAQVFQSQVISLIVEGVFDQFPTLRVALIEGGFTWMPSLMWRLDKEWKGLRREVPWVKQLPSNYIREHIRLTIQPVDAPAEPHHLQQIITQLDSEELLMFSTDYPHWHFDSPEMALPVELPPTFERKIMAENAREFYQL